MKYCVPRTPFSTPLSGSAKEIELRLKNIMSGPKKRPPVLFLALMFSVCIFCGNLVSCQMSEAQTPDTPAPDSSAPEVRTVPIDPAYPPANEEEEFLVQALFSAADVEEPFQIPEAWLLACIQGDGCLLGAVQILDHLEDTLLLGVMDKETHELTGPLFRCAYHSGTGMVEPFRQEGVDYLLYTFNGWDMKSTGEAGLIRFDGTGLSWVWPVEGDIRDRDGALYQEYQNYWYGHFACVIPGGGGVDVYVPNPDFTYGSDPEAAKWLYDHSEYFLPTSSNARSAYVRVLEDLLYRYNLPDGTNGKAVFDDLSENTFALADVDGDGREELVLLVRPNIYAGYTGYILDYDPATGSVHTQFEGFPSFTFYSNGALTEDDSHAQGSWTSEFWPHSLYQYLPETDSYEFVGHVDAWEKAVSDINQGNLPPFPTEKDTSGAGILYYINAPSHGTYNERINLAVDQSVYLEWLESYIGDSQPLELEYLPLTEENIAQIR